MNLSRLDYQLFLLQLSLLDSPDRVLLRAVPRVVQLDALGPPHLAVDARLVESRQGLASRARTSRVFRVVRA